MAHFCSKCLQVTTIVGCISDDGALVQEGGGDGDMTTTFPSVSEEWKSWLLSSEREVVYIAPIFINDSEVENIMFLGANIINSLSWSKYIDATTKKAHQLIGRLKKPGLS